MKNEVRIVFEFVPDVPDGSVGNQDNPSVPSFVKDDDEIVLLKSEGRVGVPKIRGRVSGARVMRSIHDVPVDVSNHDTTSKREILSSNGYLKHLIVPEGSMIKRE